MNGYKVVNTDHLRIWRNLGDLDGNQGADNNLIRIESLFQVLGLYTFELSRFITFGPITIIIKIYHVPTGFLINLLAEVY